jgi:hypothetical protein
MQEEEVHNYIRSCRADGIGDREIAQALLASGWTGQQVADAFNVVSGIDPAKLAHSVVRHPDFLVYFGVLFVILVVGVVAAYLLATHHLF